MVPKGIRSHTLRASRCQDVISRWNWGGSELMAIAANFLQNDIYVIAYNTNGQHDWHCSRFRPSTTKRGYKVIETGLQVPLTLDQCIAAIR